MLRAVLGQWVPGAEMQEDTEWGKLLGTPSLWERCPQRPLSPPEPHSQWDVRGMWFTCFHPALSGNVLMGLRQQDGHLAVTRAAMQGHVPQLLSSWSCAGIMSVPGPGRARTATLSAWNCVWIASRPHMSYWSCLS
jgi:hypothetical protein